MNPEAGSGITARRVGKISGKLSSEGISHRTAVAGSPEELVDISSLAHSDGFSGIILCGGDGTVSSAVSGLIHGKTTIPVTVIPEGSGNDWARSLGILSISDTIRVIGSGAPVMMDAAQCIVRDASGSNIRSRIVANSAGMGLDAHVLERSLGLRQRRGMGRLGYISSLLASVTSMPTWEGGLEMDGEPVFDGAYFSLTCGVGPFSGGGMMLSPSASPFDDYLDATVVRPVSRMNLLRSLPMIYSGRLLEHPAVSSWRGREMVLRSYGDLKVEIDGEPVRDLPAGSTLIIRSMPGAFPALRLHGIGAED